MGLRIEAIALFVLLPLTAWAGPFDGTWRIDSNNARLDPKPWEQTLANGRYTCTTCDPKIDVQADGTDQKDDDHPVHRISASRRAGQSRPDTFALGRRTNGGTRGLR